MYIHKYQQAKDLFITLSILYIHFIQTLTYVGVSEYFTLRRG